MKHFNKQILAPCLALGALFLSSQAFGFTTTINPNVSGFGNPDATNLLTVGVGMLDVNQAFTLYYNVPGLSSLGNALTANANILVTDFSFSDSQTTLQLDITLSNTIALGDTARITSFGMFLDPNATSASILKVTGPFDDIDNGALPSFSVINQCAFGGPNCQGGGAPGNSILAGDSAHFILTFLYDGDVTDGGVKISQFPIKWQSALGGCSYETSPNKIQELKFADYANSTSCGGNDVPEPGSMLLMFGGLGLMLAGYRRYIN